MLFTRYALDDSTGASLFSATDLTVGPVFLATARAFGPSGADFSVETVAYFGTDPSTAELNFRLAGQGIGDDIDYFGAEDPRAIEIEIDFGFESYDDGSLKLFGRVI